MHLYKSNKNIIFYFFYLLLNIFLLIYQISYKLKLKPLKQVATLDIYLQTLWQPFIKFPFTVISHFEQKITVKIYICLAVTVKGYQIEEILCHNRIFNDFQRVKGGGLVKEKFFSTKKFFYKNSLKKPQKLKKSNEFI